MARPIEVVGAVIVHDGLVLCAQRGPHGALPGLWEFPGGKVEPAETAQDALRREVAEELQCVVQVGEELTTTTHQYEFAAVTLTTFWCRLAGGVPVPTEHVALKWLTPAELPSLAGAPADLPTVTLLSARPPNGSPTAPASAWLCSGTTLTVSSLARVELLPPGIYDLLRTSSLDRREPGNPAGHVGNSPVEARRPPGTDPTLRPVGQPDPIQLIVLRNEDAREFGGHQSRQRLGVLLLARTAIQQLLEPQRAQHVRRTRLGDPQR